MKPSVFNLLRLEFTHFEVERNREFSADKAAESFPQIDFEFNNVNFEFGAQLLYPDNELDDPRHFTVAASFAVRQSMQDDVVLPYSVTLQGSAFLYFKGEHTGMERFRAVRATAYMMLYGAFREQVANFTSRSSHGLWFLPAPTFNEKADLDAAEDVRKWELALESSKIEKIKPSKKPAARRAKKIVTED